MFVGLFVGTRGRFISVRSSDSKFSLEIRLESLVSTLVPHPILVHLHRAIFSFRPNCSSILNEGISGAFIISNVPPYGNMSMLTEKMYKMSNVKALFSKNLVTLSLSFQTLKSLSTSNLIDVGRTYF